MGDGGGTGSTAELGRGDVASATIASSGIASSTVEELDELVLLFFDSIIRIDGGVEYYG